LERKNTQLSAIFKKFLFFFIPASNKIGCPTQNKEVIFVEKLMPAEIFLA